MNVQKNCKKKSQNKHNKKLLTEDDEKNITSLFIFDSDILLCNSIPKINKRVKEETWNAILIELFGNVSLDNLELKKVDA